MSDREWEDEVIKRVLVQSPMRNVSLGIEIHWEELMVKVFHCEVVDKELGSWAVCRRSVFCDAPVMSIWLQGFISALQVMDHNAMVHTSTKYSDGKWEGDRFYWDGVWEENLQYDWDDNF